MTKGRFQISGWLVAEDRNTPYDGSTETPNPLQERTRVRVWLITGDVRLSSLSGLQIAVSVPDITRSAVVTTTTPAINFSETFRGIGDTSVIAWRRMVSSTGWNVTVNGGVSLPTGKTERPRFRTVLDEDSLVPVSRLQRGSGTVDPLVGVTANKVIARIFPPGVRFFATAAARLPVGENEFGLRTGTSAEVGAGISRELKWHSIIGIARVGWLHREQDVFEGTPVLVGGGDWISFAPALAVQATKKLTVQVELKLPIYRSLANRQLDSARTAQLGLVWAF